VNFLMSQAQRSDLPCNIMSFLQNSEILNEVRVLSERHTIAVNVSSRKFKNVSPLKKCDRGSSHIFNYSNNRLILNQSMKY